MKEKVDDFDVISSIWIISCNDENPIISYESLKYRLNLPKDFDLKSLVKHRGDLFRLKVPEYRLNNWKSDMLNGIHIPSWIKVQNDEESRKKLINELSIEDVFRNQFRTKDKSEKCPIEIIDWGLQHIERLRLAKSNSFESRLKKWSIIRIPMLSLTLALLTVLSSVYYQYKTQQVQIQLKKYEVSFRPKQENYSIFLCSMISAFDCARTMNHNALLNNLDKIEKSYYNLEPFLNTMSRKNILNQYQQFSAMCFQYEKYKQNFKNDSIDNKYIDSFIWYRNYFRENLYPVLFEK